MQSVTRVFRQSHSSLEGLPERVKRDPFKTHRVSDLSERGCARFSAAINRAVDFPRSKKERGFARDLAQPRSERSDKSDTR